MKFIYIISAVLWMICSASAAVYQDLENGGAAHYTNELSEMTADKLPDAVELKKVASKPSLKTQVSLYDDPMPRITVAQEESQRREALQKNGLKQRKEMLEREYHQLLGEKLALDKNKSFQKRRIKRKYKHRPYIQEMIKKEWQIKARLMQVEAELKMIESQL
jgi:hypothetical protein